MATPNPEGLTLASQCGNWCELGIMDEYYVVFFFQHGGVTPGCFNIKALIVFAQGVLATLQSVVNGLRYLEKVLIAADNFSLSY